MAALTDAKDALLKPIARLTSDAKHALLRLSKAHRCFLVAALADAKHVLRKLSKAHRCFAAFTDAWLASLKLGKLCYTR